MEKESIKLVSLEKALHFASMNYHSNLGSAEKLTAEEVVEIATKFENYLNNKQ